jgi:hypothetical protein
MNAGTLMAGGAVAGEALKAQASGIFGKMKSAVGMQQQEEKGLLGQVDEAVTLTWKQRLIG